MIRAVDDLERVMLSEENAHLEFKEASTQFDFEKLANLSCALANEGGGHLILGVTDKKPRRVVGSNAFRDLEETSRKLLGALHLRIDAMEVSHPNGRVVVFEVPARPPGVPIQHRGAYWMRIGGSLAPMPQDRLKRIFDEAGPDFSAEICPNATIDDLEREAVNRFRAMWQRKSGLTSLHGLSGDQLLRDAELVVGQAVTFAALILMGTRAALGRHLPQAETIFEYRSSDASLPVQQRKEYREGFFLWYDDLWATVNLRNEVQQFRDGLFVYDITTFNQAVVREAILNAVAHRDYRLGGSVFVRQFPRRLEIVSPGGFPPGVSAETILDRQSPRNRRIAEALQRCGLVERSGQGANRMFEESIKEGKPHPDFSESDNHQVAVVLRGDIQDPRFLRFLEKVGGERLKSFTTHDFLVLDCIHREEPLPEPLKVRLPALVEHGVVERVGSGRGTRYILSRNLHGLMGKKGVYTRRRGLDRETNKELLLRHMRETAAEGCQLRDLMQVLPSLSRPQVQALLRELKSESRAYSSGRTKSARWFFGKLP